MSLLREIQHDIASGDVDVATLLRKCKILAARLGSDQFAQWVERELNGYPESQSTPEYRRLAITYYASFYGLGWKVPQAAVPLQVVPEKHRDSFSTIEFRDGIAKAESLAERNKRVSVERPELTFLIQGKMYPELQCHRVWGELSSIEFEQLVSAVKNRILDFSLKIEAENPDAGEALPHTHLVPPEKLQPIVQNTFYGTVGAITQHSEHFSQNVNIGISTDDMRRLVKDLSDHLNELNLDDRQRQRVELQIATLRAEIVGEADPAIVKQAARTLRNITEGAIGSLLATAAQPSVWHWVQQTLATLSN